jgi:hypothetical protein
MWPGLCCAILAVSALTSCQGKNNAPTGGQGAGGSQGSGGKQGSGGEGSGGSGGTAGSGSGGVATGGGPGSGGLQGSGGVQATGGKGGGGTVGPGGSGSGGVAAAGGKGGGGSIGTGGSGSGGNVAGAGSSGTRTGGSTGSNGGGGGGGGGIGSGGSTGTGSCTFTQSAKLGSKIKTVGIITWKTDLAGLKSAKIDFGLDTNYGMTAPVDNPVAGDNTTLLLGMKPTVSSSSPRVYHYRITATGTDGDCVSPDYTITTGALMSGLPKATVTNKSTASPLFGGFILMGNSNSASAGGPAYIIDKDGDIVWAIAVTPDAVGVRMSADGKYVWINCVNLIVGASNGSMGTACVHRVSIDGEKDEDLSSKFKGMTHQLSVMPDDTISYYAYSTTSDCFDIKEYNPSTGATRTIVNSQAAFNTTSCHLTNIQYLKEEDSLYVSDLYSESVIKIKHSDGSLIWRMNGKTPTISGVTWAGGNHGLHVLGPDHLLIFNNNSRQSYGGPADGTGDGSIALEVQVDTAAKTAKKLWSYKANPGVQVDILGDLQRLPNGNTIVGYATKGVLHEVDKNGTLLQEWMWPAGSAFGYLEKRASLYGPPPK